MARGDDVAGLVAAVEPVHEHERGRALARAVLPARTRQQANAVADFDHQVLDRRTPAQAEAVQVAEQCLAMAADRPGTRVEPVERGGDRAHGHSTILPKCLEASIISCARRASASGSVACTTVRRRRWKKKPAASSSFALLPMYEPSSV